ncbi:uncharacterized protein [Epargyreus clarus]|uniref:uncharacterized protein n=1 Tax=Epargyreus clarus TaxID=520877 RepID=UPI003C2BD1CD
MTPAQSYASDGPDAVNGVSTPPVWSEEHTITEAELEWAVKRLAVRTTAPGPDGIPGRAWVVALPVLGERLRRLFTDCLRFGKFPAQWRLAKVVLLQKAGRPLDSPASYRPICLLNEAGKIFERIIAVRVSRHLSCIGPDLSDNQFGFRVGRSIMDAILRVRALTERAFSRGRVVLAISLENDTLVLAEGGPYEGTARLAEQGVARVVAEINALGLRIASNKTEALWFHGRRPNVRPPCMSVRVGDAVIEVGRYSKYLGLVLDSHCCQISGDRRRKSVRSVALYGAPVWSDRLSGCRRRAAKLNVAQRLIAISRARILTGHGCFGEYLHRIGGEATAQCHHCGHAQDSAQHTLKHCPAWQSERRILVQRIGPDLSPEALVAAMVRSVEAWDSVVAFCERVMVAKEDAERARERADPARRRRRRRRR